MCYKGVLPPDFSGAAVYLQLETDDETLVERCLQGDGASFRPLVEKYQRALFSLALRMLGDYEEARDATQNAFVKAYERLAAFDPGYRFFSWIYRIAVNECLNVLRARRRTSEFDPDLPGGDGPFEAMQASEVRDRIRAALARLSADYREVVVLRHYGELSYREIGEVLRIPEKTVKSRLFTARQRLAELMNGTGR
jgi:RNA polymerase sigma-70 factor (ECF subfamily)